MKTKKLLSILLAVAMIVSLFTVTASAAGMVGFSRVINGELFYNYTYEACIGDTIELGVQDVTLDGVLVDADSVDYQWSKLGSFTRPDGSVGEGYFEIDGATQSTYSIQSYDGTLGYMCMVVVNDTYRSSTEFRFEVDTLSVSVSSNKDIALDEDEVYCINDLSVGDEVRLTVDAVSTATDANLTYSWSYIYGYAMPDSENQYFNMLPDTTNTINIVKDVEGIVNYYCEVSDGNITETVFFMLVPKKTITHSSSVNGGEPTTFAGTYIYVTKPNQTVEFKVPATSTNGTLVHNWYYRRLFDDAIRLDESGDTLNIVKSAPTEDDPYASETFECYLTDENERIRVTLMVFCLDPTKTLAEIEKLNEQTPDITIETDDEDLANGVLDGTALKYMPEGANAGISLTTELVDAVDPQEQDAINQLLPDDTNVDMLLDINLYQLFEGEASQVTEAGTDIELSIALPESMVSASAQKEYKIIRMHNGVAEELDCIFNADTNKLSFSTNKFSTYAVAALENDDIDKPQLEKVNVTVSDGSKLIEAVVDASSIDGYTDVSLSFEQNGVETNVSEYISVGDTLVFSYTVTADDDLSCTLNTTAQSGNAVTDNMVVQLGRFTDVSSKYSVFKKLDIGDANNDGEVNVKDLVRIKRILAEIVDTTVNADVNGDTAVDNNDLVGLAKYILKAKTGIKVNTVNFYGNDGALLQVLNVIDGFTAKPTLPQAPDGFVFAGWDKSLTNITQNMDVTALFIENDDLQGTIPDWPYDD